MNNEMVNTANILKTSTIQKDFTLYLRSAILPIREFRGRPREGTTASDVHI